MDSILKRFAREQERGRLADCMLLLGPSRQRLRDLSLRLSASILEAKGEVKEHPDAVFFDPEELGVKSLQVAHIAEREGGQDSVESALRYKPLRGGKRVLVLYDVDRMNQDAQAALLKTSEEPPRDTHLVLTAADASPVLPALLSRCRITRLQEPSAEEVEQRAASLSLEPQALLILKQALGRAESALELDFAQRERFLTLRSGFLAWMRDPSPAAEWQIPPDGSVGEQRQELIQRFAACLGWAVAEYSELASAQALSMDRLILALSDALADLQGQVTPSLVCEHLALRVRALGSCTT